MRWRSISSGKAVTSFITGSRTVATGRSASFLSKEAFENFGVVGGRGDLIERYFELFPEMQLYPDVLPTLERLAGRYRLAVVSNIDDDLLGATRLYREFDLVCTAERARGYKPDGTLFRYLIANAGVAVPDIL